MYRLLLCFLLITGIAQGQNPQLTIEIQNIETIKGNIVIGIFNKSEKFLKEPFVFKSYIISIKKNTETIIIDDLPKGEYAFIIYHDKNSDCKLNENFIGVPKESFGFSNNIRPKFKKPTFDECKFVFAKNSFMKIKLGYY